MSPVREETKANPRAVRAKTAYPRVRTFFLPILSDQIPMGMERTA